MEEKGLSLACGPSVLSGCLGHPPHPQLHKVWALKQLLAECWVCLSPAQAQPLARSSQGSLCLPAYVLPVKLEVEMVTQQYEKAKAIQEEQLERLTQICQEQGVSNTFRSTHLRPGLAEDPVMPGSQSLGTAEVHRPHSASSCASVPASSPPPASFTAKFNKCV